MKQFLESREIILEFNVSWVCIPPGVVQCWCHRAHIEPIYLLNLSSCWTYLPVREFCHFYKCTLATDKTIYLLILFSYLKYSQQPLIIPDVQKSISNFFGTSALITKITAIKKRCISRNTRIILWIWCCFHCLTILEHYEKIQKKLCKYAYF